MVYGGDSDGVGDDDGGDGDGVWWYHHQWLVMV